MLKYERKTGKSNHIKALVSDMTLSEKIGQMVQVNSSERGVTEKLRRQLQAGKIGSVLNEVEPEAVEEMQRIAREESRLGIPLLIGRDVIHGFNTIFPIPLGQAATWNRELVEKGARYAAEEASLCGINWTFAPMLDVSRDPRWGRIAECLGEDPILTSELGAAMVRGFQTDKLERPDAILSCAKHFAGYGATESGRDYNSANIPEVELRNTFFPPFLAAIAAGSRSVMTSFSDLNGVPPTANGWLLRQVLREEWNFTGLVVSDWESINELINHGVAADEKQATLMATMAGVNMDMESNAYAKCLEGLVVNELVDEELIDELVVEILNVKFDLGLFNEPQKTIVSVPSLESKLELAKQLALESVVLLKNDQELLPLDSEATDSIAVIGPLADDGYEQMGTWVFDGDAKRSQTVLEALLKRKGFGLDVQYVQALKTTRTHDQSGFENALNIARKCDIVLLVMGEESILSGEAHCRADIQLPGAQEALIEAVSACGKPIILVVMAGRPLVLKAIVDKVDAIFFAWHPGSMGGPAIVDLLFGNATPSGKLPVTFPRSIGQVPIYYGHRNTGRPVSEDTVMLIDDIEPRAPQTSIGNRSFHLDVDPTPLFDFGYGLSYTRFEYSELRLERYQLVAGEHLEVEVSVSNVGSRTGEEIAQLYVRDLVASVARPVRELKDFCRVRLTPGEEKRIHFSLPSSSLAFYDGDGVSRLESGNFRLWVGGSSLADLSIEFELVV